MIALERTSGRAVKTSRASTGGNMLVVWIALVGMFFPPMLFSIGGTNFTPGRFVLILFLVPSLVLLLKGGRRSVASDFFAVAFVIWILLSSVLNGGFKPYVAAEALEFISAYLLGRAFIFGPAKLEMFIRALKIIIIVIVAFALVDTFSGRHVTMDSFGLTPLQSLLNGNNEYRFGLVRAASLFIGPEQNGTFCAMAASIFLYTERGAGRNWYVSLSVFGCALALSSGPIMGLALITSLFFYDRCMQAYPWRWKLVVSAAIGGTLLIFVFSDQPIQWILVHMTLDPQTGFFRLGMWNYALPLVGQSPFIGYGLTQLGDSGESKLYLWSVDSIWLVEVLRYGLPAAILLFLTMFSSSFAQRPKATLDRGARSVSTGLTLAIVAFGIVGLTVHFWDASWLFLNFCIGVRASLAEYKTLDCVLGHGSRPKHRMTGGDLVAEIGFSHRLGGSGHF